MKVPPPPLSEGVTVTVPVMTPSAPAVKLVEALPAVPVLGPLMVTAVAAPLPLMVSPTVLVTVCAEGTALPSVRCRVMV